LTELFIAHTAGDHLGAMVVSLGARAATVALGPLTGSSTLLPMLVVAVVPHVLRRTRWRRHLSHSWPH
jgi:ATP-binding cassette, subfamily C, bacterial CydC